MRACNISPSIMSRSPLRFRAARVSPCATMLTVAPHRVRRAAIVPPIAPAPKMQNFGEIRMIEGLPRLPDLEFAIYEKARPDKAASALAAALLALRKVHRGRRF